jgi:hypothetical protein
VHQADLPRPGRLESHAGEEQFSCRRSADLREHVGRDRRRHQPEFHLGEPEHGVVGGDHDVADGHQAGAAAERRPVDPADERNRQRVERFEKRREARRIAQVLLAREGDGFGHPRQVRARGKRLACPGEHGHAHIVAARQAARPVRELGNQRRVEGVSHVGPVEGDVLDKTLAASGNRRVVHTSWRHVTSGRRRTSRAGSAH